MNGLRPVADLAADRPHGDRLRYLAGCRCFHCRRANSDYERERKAARLAGDWNGLIPAERARAHLLALSRAGVGKRAVAAASDVAVSVVSAVRSGRKARIRARTERRLLAVTTAMVSDGALIKSGRALRLLEELTAEGFSKAELARRLGYATPALQFNRPRIRARSLARIQALRSKLTV
jgi:hypothetical protein